MIEMDRYTYLLLLTKGYGPASVPSLPGDHNVLPQSIVLRMGHSWNT